MLMYLLKHLHPSSRTSAIEEHTKLPEYTSSQDSLRDFQTTFVSQKPDRQILYINLSPDTPIIHASG
ncbi:hypothetical protein PtB15_18B434 [Puccinia triticina]|nr:hypothetical protein PtB15_18B434 [Puccinia triticina]